MSVPKKNRSRPRRLKRQRTFANTLDINSIKCEEKNGEKIYKLSYYSKEYKI